MQFLYSSADQLIRADEIEQYVQMLSSCGYDTRRHCWTDSPHVAYFLMHQVEYGNLLLQFYADIFR